jgi:hypothetical protein
MSKINAIGFCLSACLSLSAYSGEKTVHWKQEVQLQDGRVIIMDRTSVQTGKIIPENVSMEKSQSITFVNPDTNEKVAWDIPKGLLPYALDFDDKTPYLVLTSYTVADYNNWNCPSPPYLIYRYQDHGWNSIPIEQLPSRFEKRNLIDMSKEYQRFSQTDLLTLDQFQKWIKENLKDRRVIGREKINPIGRGCDESTLYRLGRQSEIDTRR